MNARQAEPKRATAQATKPAATTTRTHAWNGAAFIPAPQARAAPTASARRDAFQRHARNLASSAGHGTTPAAISLTAAPARQAIPAARAGPVLLKLTAYLK